MIEAETILYMDLIIRAANAGKQYLHGQDLDSQGGGRTAHWSIGCEICAFSAKNFPTIPGNARQMRSRRPSEKLSTSRTFDAMTRRIHRRDAEHAKSAEKKTACPA